MNDLISVHPLEPSNTVTASHVTHRLVLGVQCVDALTQQPAGSRLTCELDSIGTRPIAQFFSVHAHGRHALLHAGRLAKLLARAFELVQSMAFNLRTYGYKDGTKPGYRLENEPRTYVPRRVSLTPVLDADGIPPSNRDNIRIVWLWPGATYPLPGKATAIRGHLRRGVSLTVARNIAWARLVVTRPNGAADFDTETQLAWGHGDDRGEFIILLGAAAVPGGVALPPTINLRLWVFLPPNSVNFDPADPLASLPLEDGGTDAVNDVSRGRAIPPGYVKQAAIDLTVKPGATTIIADAALLYG